MKNLLTCRLDENVRLRRARICSASTHDSPFRLLAWANSRCSFSAYQSGDCAAAQRLPHALIRLQVRRTQDFLPDRALARHHIEVMVARSPIPISSSWRKYPFLLPFLLHHPSHPTTILHLRFFLTSCSYPRPEKFVHCRLNPLF